MEFERRIVGPEEAKEATLFPSPCGVMEFELIDLYFKTNLEVFPSPCGVMEFEQILKSFQIFFLLFPSPCGVMEFEPILRWKVVVRS